MLTCKQMEKARLQSKKKTAEAALNADGKGKAQETGGEEDAGRRKKAGRGTIKESRGRTM